MLERLNEKDRRAVKIGIAGVVAIAVFAVGMKGYDHWAEAKRTLSSTEARLGAISVDETKLAGLLSIVPVFEMPKAEEEQKFLFRDRLNEQLRRAGIRSKPLQVVSGRKSKTSGYRMLRLKCSATCRFTQLLDLLANLNENPYLVGVEELRIKCNPKQRREVDMEMVVSTFVEG